MNSEAIYHRPRNEFAYYDKRGTVTLLLRAASGDLRRATLCWFDKYVENQPHAQMEMECFLEDDLFAYYRAQVTPPYRRLQYYFRLEDVHGETWYLDEQGTHHSQEGCTEACFQMPYLNPNGPKTRFFIRSSPIRLLAVSQSPPARTFLPGEASRIS